MNYYALWVSLSDGSNAFYDPVSKFLTLGAKEGDPMPSEYFFLLDDLSAHQELVLRAVHMYEEHHPTGINMRGACKLHITELRPQDPDYAAVHSSRGDI